MWIKFVVIILCCSHCSHMFTDPEHQRAKGNLKYFEFQLEKQRKDAEEETTKEKEEREEPDITEKKKKKSHTKSTFQLIPERKKYEMLCRSEGIKMVRKEKKEENHLLGKLVCSHSDCCFSSLNQTPRRQSRLFCRYYDNNHNPKYVLSPVKQQDEWDRPYIVRYIDIISDKEIETVKKLAKPRVSNFSVLVLVCRQESCRCVSENKLAPLTSGGVGGQSCEAG